MATGIFSTTRVAGEGIALALVVALLAGLLQLSMAATLPEHPQLPLAAQQLASGNLQASAALLPELGRELLLGLYAKAFTWLLYALIAITLVAALVVRLMLHEPRRA